MKKILIIGSSSAIAEACGRLWAAQQASFFLVARNEEKLEAMAADLRVRGARAVFHYSLDVNVFKSHASMLDACYASLGSIDVVLIAHGTLPDQDACEQDMAKMLEAFSTNGLSTIVLAGLISNKLEKQDKKATMAIISSVAGDRGRCSNYIYGAAKAAVSTFSEGLRGRLFSKNIHVLTIKPGFVATPMTAGMSLPRLLVAKPDCVAKDIVCAIDKRRDVLYTPWFWKWIMLLIRCLPSPLFKRLGI